MAVNTFSRNAVGNVCCIKIGGGIWGGGRQGGRGNVLAAIPARSAGFLPTPNPLENKTKINTTYQAVNTANLQRQERRI